MRTKEVMYEAHRETERRTFHRDDLQVAAKVLCKDAAQRQADAEARHGKGHRKVGRPPPLRISLARRRGEGRAPRNVVVVVIVILVKLRRRGCIEVGENAGHARARDAAALVGDLQCRVSKHSHQACAIALHEENLTLMTMSSEEDPAEMMTRMGGIPPGESL